MIDKNQAIMYLNGNLEFIKKKKGLSSDAELAKKTGIAKGTISSVRKGRMIPMLFPFFVKLCEYSGYTVDDLISRDLWEDSDTEKPGVDESLEQEFKKYEGVYTAYYFGTSSLKGRERNDDREAICYAVILICRNEDGGYGCIGDFGLTREQQKERYNACFKRNERGKLIRIRNYRSEFINRYICDNLYDGTFTITDGSIVIKLESTQDSLMMMLNKARNNAGKYEGGLAASISVCKGVRPVPVMQIVGISRGIITDMPQMIGQKLSLSYPSIKCQEEDEVEVFRLLRTITDERAGVSSIGIPASVLDKDTMRDLLHIAMNRAIDRTVRRNIVRTIRVTEVDDDDWNHMIRKYEEV